jgi:phospholipid/cholesterol/gamma-HCH transport system substrate-binding protein
LQAPREPSSRALVRNQVLDSNHVTVEIDTVFQRLVAALSKIDPPKLNATLRAIAQAFNGRGEKMGEAFTNLNSFLAKIEPTLPNLSHDLSAAPEVLNAYADAAPDLLTTADNTTRLSDTLVDEQQNFESFLVSSIALADTGNDVIGTNRDALTSVVKLLVPTTDVLNHYHDSLRCMLGGLIPFMKVPELPDPGVDIDATFNLGIDRYRYPKDLPKVAAKGGTYCEQLGLPFMHPGFRPPSIVADTGTNPWHNGNQGILLNSDAHRQFLFGPLDGPPRNSAQTGQPG